MKEVQIDLTTLHWNHLKLGSFHLELSFLYIWGFQHSQVSFKNLRWRPTEVIEVWGTWNITKSRNLLKLFWVNLIQSKSEGSWSEWKSLIPVVSMRENAVDLLRFLKTVFHRFSGQHIRHEIKHSAVVLKMLCSLLTSCWYRSP